jgi:hypothetical protein
VSGFAGVSWAGPRQPALGSGALAFEANAAEPKLVGEAALNLLEHTAGGDLAAVARERLLAQAWERVLPSGPTATVPGCRRP